jgi:hypothetical protein
MLDCKEILILLSITSSAAMPINIRVDSRAVNTAQLSPRVRFVIGPKIGPSRQAQRAVSSLTDGNYQFCSQPDPRDWRDGAGVCFSFSKKERAIDGYYGYSHSDSFVCVRGQVTGNSIIGKALALSWPGQGELIIPPTEFIWDAEGHLNLNQGEIRRQSGKNELQESWVVFRKAKLDVSNFYRYDVPRMRPVTELCDWDR